MQNGLVPRLVRPTPLPPMSVSTAAKVFGSEVLIALIRHCRTNPGTSQGDACEALQLPNQLVSTSIRRLIQAGVVVEITPARGRRPGAYAIDEDRVRHLLREIADYSLGD